MKFKALRRCVLLGVLGLGSLCAYQMASAQPISSTITVASTTSTEQSGLFKHLLPLFKKASGIDVKVVALGTGQALDAARRGDADVLLVHDRAAEDQFVAEGYAQRRDDMMYNDFVLIGPRTDPAHIKGRDAVQAFQALATQQIPFVSRGDKSGTHAAENRFWQLAKVQQPFYQGYKSCGCGMGPALNMAAATGSYVLADRGTWVAFKNRSNLAILVEGDRRLFNPYGVMLVSPQKHPHVKHQAGQVFIDWLIGSAGQTAIAQYKINGETLFFPMKK